MLFERIVSEGISHNSYLIGSGGRAAVIDPRRDCDIYLRIARRNALVITHIFETHRNEDYVIGSLELKERCGAEIYHGAQLAFAYGEPVKEGDMFTLGSLELLVLETPGHTEESISIVVYDKEISDSPYMIFSAGWYDNFCFSICDRFPGITIPYHTGFPLVCNCKACNFRCLN